VRDEQWTPPPFAEPENLIVELRQSTLKPAAEVQIPENQLMPTRFLL
jgi:hypothetical protein